MKVNQAIAVSIFFSLTALAGTALSQTIASQSQSDNRSPVIRFVMNKLTTEHISPRPVDDSFSMAVFRDYIGYLDPEQHNFLQSDIDRLKAQQYLIDEQLKSGSTAFFDSALSIYKIRITELGQLYRKLLDKPLDLDKNETISPAHPFPASNTERMALWAGKLKMEVLKRYTALAGDQAKLQPALEIRARQSVLNMYDGYFSRQLTDKSINDKFNAYVNTVASRMDPHSTYSGPDYAELFPGIDGKPYYGLGLDLENSGTDIIIKRIITGSTADKSGLFRLNDRIVAVRDKNGNMIAVTGMQAREVAGILSSSKDAPAVLKLEDQALMERIVTVPREELIKLDFKPRSAVLVQDGVKYGYIKLPIFYGGNLYPKEVNSGFQMETEIEKLRAREVKAVILDLRGNPGGAVDVAQYIGGLFGLKNVMSITEAKFNATFERPGNTVLYTDPLIVLTDESSASASELFAGAVQDEGRGIVMGTGSTYGKATGQISIAVVVKDSVTGERHPGLGYLNLTVKKIYRGNGTSNQIRGLIPDIVLIEKTKLYCVREKNYPNALPGGIYKEAAYIKGKINFDYDLVVKNAQDRIKSNEQVKLITGNMAKLEELLAQPVELNWQKYAIRTKEYRQLESAMKQATEAAGGQPLLVENSMPEWMNPNGIHPFQMLEYQDWLKTLGKDIYLLEAVNVAKDMVARPK